MKDRIPVSQPVTISCHSNMDVTKAVNQVWFKNPKGQVGIFDTISWIEDKKKVRICTPLPIPGIWKIWLVTEFPGKRKKYISSSFCLKVYKRHILKKGKLDLVTGNIVGMTQADVLNLIESYFKNIDTNPAGVSYEEFNNYKTFINEQLALVGGSDPVGNITYGTKYTGTDSGTLFQMSIDDDFLYICVVAGEAPDAIWKRIPLRIY